MQHPVPVLGRSVVVRPGADVPEPWSRVDRHRVDADTIGDSVRLGNLVDVLQAAWVRRRPVIVELSVDESELRVREPFGDPAWDLGAEFTVLRERLLHVVWSNSYDLRRDRPVWWWSVKASRLGATIGGPCDVALPDGTSAWIDGGPRGDVEAPDIGATDAVVVSSETVTWGSLEPEPAPRPPLSDGLAPDQLAAVAHGAGPARIVAPAGSGKTRTLHARLRHLVDDRRIPTRFVTAVAYNNRAAAELRGRLPDHLAATVQTIHALGRGVLISGRGNLRLLEEREVRRRLEPIVPVARRPNTDIIGPYLEGMADVRIGLRPPDEVEAERDDVPELSRVLDVHRRTMREGGECDFDEFIFGAIEVLLEDPELRSRWQWSCRHLLVDEFQDLTPAYLLLIRLLASPALDVFGVGDDDQVIYGYAGADPAFLIEYERLFPGAAGHALEVNYRCPQPVVDGASTLLGYNRRRVEKSIRPADEAATSGLSVDRRAAEDCVPHVVDRIRGWLDDGAAPTDVVVLCRVNAALLPVHVALVDAGIPFRSPLDRSVLSRTVMDAALAWIRLARSDTLRRTDLLTSVRRPSRGLNRLARELIGGRRDLDLTELRRVGSRLDGRRAERWDEWCADLAAIRRVAGGGDAPAVVDGLIHTVGLDRAAAALDAGRSRADRSAQSDDLRALVRLAALHPRLDDFESWLREALGTSPDDSGVQLTTIHRVKGLEWPNVIVYGADRDLMPHGLSDDVEEERRIFHVAITRARSEVVVVADEDRPSRFLDELSGRAEIRAETTPTPARTGIVVEVGQQVELAGGYRGRVARRIPTGVLVEIAPGPGRVAVAWGESVIVDGAGGPLAPASIEPDAALVDRLKTWRLETARGAGVPAYVVLTDATIDELAARRPRTEQELLSVKGIGPAKLEAYGDDLLDLVAD